MLRLGTNILSWFVHFVFFVEEVVSYPLDTGKLSNEAKLFRDRS